MCIVERVRKMNECDIVHGNCRIVKKDKKIKISHSDSADVFEMYDLEFMSWPKSFIENYILKNTNNIGEEKSCLR